MERERESKVFVTLNPELATQRLRIAEWRGVESAIPYLSSTDTRSHGGGHTRMFPNDKLIKAKSSRVGSPEARERTAPRPRDLGTNQMCGSVTATSTQSNKGSGLFSENGPLLLSIHIVLLTQERNGDTLLS